MAETLRYRGAARALQRLRRRRGCRRRNVCMVGASAARLPGVRSARAGRQSFRREHASRIHSSRPDPPNEDQQRYIPTESKVSKSQVQLLTKVEVTQLI